MFEELSEIMKGSVDVLFWDQVVELTKAFEVHGVTYYVDRITELYNIGNTLDRVALVDSCRGILTEQIEDIFRQLNIKVDLNEISFGKVAEILTVLAFHPDDRDHEALAALEQAEDAVEGLMEILSVYTGVDPFEYAPAILEVGEHVLPAIRAVLQLHVSYAENTSFNLEEVVASLHAHQRTVGQEPTVALESLHLGMEPGASMDVLVESARERLLDMSAERLVDELIALSILAGTPASVRRTEVLKYLEQFSDDPFQHQKAFKCLNLKLGKGDV